MKGASAEISSFPANRRLPVFGTVILIFCASRPIARLRRAACVLAIGALFGVPAACPAVPALSDLEALRQMNIGKAQLENGDYGQAITVFRAALDTRPHDRMARRNLARALLFKGDLDDALAALEQARTEGGSLVATEYLMGLAFLRKGDPAAAVSHLENTVRLDPSTAAVRFQLAKTYEALGRENDAIAQYRETVRLDPQHTAAHFELAMYARKQKDLETYRAELRDYKRLRDAFGDPEVSPLLLQACRYTRAEAPLIPTNLRTLHDASSTRRSIRWVEATSTLVPETKDRDCIALAPLELDANGRTTFVTVVGNGAMRLLTTTADGTLRQIGDEIPLASVGRQPVIRVGHVHETVSSEDRLKTDRPRFADVLILGESGAQLFERTAATTFVDVTAKAGLAGLRGRDARWVDYESDGDLDLLVAGPDGLSLWQNGGDGRFTNVSAATGLALSEPCGSVGAADFDANGGIDLVTASLAGSTRVFENKRAGQFRPMAEPPGPWPHAQQILIDDFDNDDSPDTALVGADRTRLKMGGSSPDQSIEHPGFVISTAALIDYDNDGWLDFCAVGHDASDSASSRIRLWRNGGDVQWTEVTADLALTALRFPEVHGIVPVDVDADGDSDLLLLAGNGQLIALRNEGGNARGQLKLRLNSLAMSNHGGIGSTIEVRSGGAVLTRLVTQELPLEIGVGHLQQLDSVQVVWPDGTVDNQIGGTPASGVLSVNRKSNLITGSCPYLYAWDGRDFRFVTDFLGSGALGLAVTRDLTWPSDPNELIRIGDAQEFRPRNGNYVITITSELREVDYFDSLRLIAVDHPSAVEVHPTDSFMPPPVTPSALWAVIDETPLIAAHDSLGRDVTESLRKTDGHFALPGEILPPPLRGVCQPITYTLDFGPLAAGEPWVLSLAGLLEFGTASSNIALSQTDTASLIWPALEAEGPDGRWQRVPVNIGIPDGRTKTQVCDLASKLPAGTRRLRLTTSFQIYWDRIALMKRRELPDAQVHEHAFTRAGLQWRGFSRVELARDGLTRIPVFADVTDLPPWHTTVEGWCTRYGDVCELISATDGKIAVLNGGDALTLECPQTAFPPVPAGFTRTFFLAAVGWDKEENPNTVDGNTVEPLPGQPPVATGESDLPDDWTQRFNTRWVPRHRFAPTTAIQPAPAQSARSADE
jgi:tetratricopeptide (TPR) repeat protein